MKKINLFSMIALAAACAFSCKGVENTETEATAESSVESKLSIAYIDLDRIIEEYDMANDKKAVVETKANNIQADITRRAKKLESDYASLQEKINKGLVTRSTAEVQAQKIAQQEQTFNNYAAQKQQEIQEEQIVMMNQIAEAIKVYVEKYNEEKKYDMILTNQGSTPVITALPSLNITDEILNGLNEEYVKSKNEKKE